MILLCTPLQAERRIFTSFHRQVFCWLDEWYGLTMDDIRRIEDETKSALEEVILTITHSELIILLSL